MKRDGALVSLWQEGMPEYAVQAQELPDKVFDVVIVGGGITGVTTGLLLQKGGKSCLIAEAYNLCFGTTGGTTAHLNTFLDTDYHTISKDFGEDNAQLLYQATRQALDLVKAHVQEYNINCGYEEKDGYVYAQDDKQASYLEDIFKASQKAGAEVEYTDNIPIPIPFQKAVVYHRQAQIHPARYVYALAKAFTEAGGVIAEACR
ncbi:MAG: FAD-binding oxidoreductase, partial [Flavisolibacter sp.]|nr:FAD-binding oxidoreductase [Flavisolibacter sp.]